MSLWVHHITCGVLSGTRVIVCTVTRYAGTPKERLEFRLTRQSNGCLEWTGGTTRGGYGSIYVDGRQVPTHRLAWELAHGPIPDGVVIRHYICDNPPCCEVSHLRPGTHADNMRDMVAKGRHVSWESTKTHCPQDHEYTEINTYHTSSGKRKCRICGRVAWSTWHRKKKARLAD